MDITYQNNPQNREVLSCEQTSLENFKRLINEKEIKCRMDDKFLFGFLNAKELDPEKSLELLKNYYSIRRNYPDIYKSLLPSKLEHVLGLKVMQFLQNQDQDGRYIFIVQLSNWDTSVANAIDLSRTMLLHMDFQWNFYNIQDHGMVFIINAAGLSYRHFLQITPRLINAMISIIFKSSSYELCFKEIHFVNMNIIMKALLRIIIPFLSPELRQRLYLHTDVKSVHKFINPQYLPVEYEGELSKFDSTEANNLIRKHEGFFQMNEDYCLSYREGQT